MEPGNKKSTFKLRSGNKPSIAKLAGLKNLFGKLQDIGKKAKDFKEKRQSESTINIKQEMQDKQARTRRGESKFQERTRMRKEFNKFKRKNKDVIKPIEQKQVKQISVDNKIPEKLEKAPKIKTPKFKDAFATARKAGKKEFTWKGKKYNTKLKSGTSGKKTKTSKKSPSNPDNFSVKTPKVNKYKKDSPSNPSNFSTTPKNPRGFNYDFEKNFFEN